MSFNVHPVPVPYTSTPLTLYQYPIPVPYTSTLYQYPIPVPYTSTPLTLYQYPIPVLGHWCSCVTENYFGVEGAVALAAQLGGCKALTELSLGSE